MLIISKIWNLYIVRTHYKYFHFFTNNSYIWKKWLNYRLKHPETENFVTGYVIKKIKLKYIHCHACLKMTISWALNITSFGYVTQPLLTLYCKFIFNAMIPHRLTIHHNKYITRKDANFLFEHELVKVLPQNKTTIKIGMFLLPVHLFYSHSCPSKFAGVMGHQ